MSAQILRAYHGDPALKARHVAQDKHHCEADMLIAGTFRHYDEYVRFRGRSVGCMAHNIDPEWEDYHAVVAEHARWPEWLAYLNDAIFEGLPEDERAFPCCPP